MAVWLSVVVWAFAVLAVSSASASFPGRNGKIFFSSVREDGSLEMFSMRPNGGSATRLTRSHPPGSDPAWSPGGKRIAFLVDPFHPGDPSVGNTELWAMNSDASGLVRLARGVNPFSSPAWSPDGRRIVFACPAGREATALCLVHRNGSHRRRITLPRKHQVDSSPSWSPDGKDIAFARTGSRGWTDIVVLNLRTAKVHALTKTLSHDEREPAWSRQGWIAYVRDEDIFLMRRDGSGTRNVTRTPAEKDDESEPSWSPDGKQIIFSSIPEGVAVIKPDGTDRRLVVETVEHGNVTSEPGDPAWSPDGGKIAFDDRFGWIWLANPDGSGTAPLLRGDWALMPAVSAEGSTVAFVTGVYLDGFSLMNPDGTNRRAASGGPDPSWAPDGRRVAIEDLGGITLVNVDGSGSERIIEPGQLGEDSDFWDPAWSPDGRKIALALEYNNGPGAIYVVSLASRRAVALTHKGSDFEPAWSPDGKRIAFDHGKGIAVMNANGSHVHMLIGKASRPAWSPDGKKIAFVRYLGKNSEIYVMNLNGSGLRRLTHNPGADLFPEWQALH
jgi:TolB protein